MQTLTFDRQCLTEALTDAVASVLETMFFSSVCSIGQSGPVPAGSTEGEAGKQEQKARLGAHLRFSGQCEGEFAFSLDSETLHPLALDFLGRQYPPAGDAELASMVCEMGNMFCGCLLSRLESQSVFHLDPPLLDQGESSLRAPKDSVSAWLALESGLLHAWIYLKDEGDSVAS